MLKYVLYCATVSILTGAGTVSADVIYDSYPKEVGASFTLAGSAVPPERAVAERFTPAANYSFDSVTLGLQSFTGTNRFDIELYTDSGPGGTPGQVLQEIIVPGVTTPINPPDVVVNASSQVSLTGGDNYYITIIPDASNTFGGWTQTPFGGPFDFLSSSSDGGTTWSAPLDETAAAMEINGTLLTPEPAAAGLVMIGSLGFLARRRNVAF